MAVILRVRDDRGKIINIPAIVGPRGPAPVRGEDYWTEEDKAEIVGLVIAEIDLQSALSAVEMSVTFEDGTTAIYKLYGRVVTE